MKRTTPTLTPTVLFFLFSVSGFSGLIYESIWTQYIKLFLGHAAYAQTLVLAIFMGGMAAGSWLASRWSHRWRDPLVVYAIIEAAIGLAALGFHYIFVAATDFSYSTIIPALGWPVAAHAWKWVLSALLILPQSLLLGMTFPLMSGGILRRWPILPGRSLAMLYFTNSIGGSVGVLASGFYLIGSVGLPGTIATAGVINLALALVVWLATLTAADAATAPAAAATESQEDRRWLPWMLTVAAITGASSFIYEIAWIRMLSLVLGSSTHAFELMLSAFILGLALGGLWIRRRIDQVGDPLRWLGHIQIAMGILALATLPLYVRSFDLMKFFLTALTRTEAGYQGFNLVSHSLCLLVMLPATFCAGMTLPLITYALIARGHGEKSIGEVYAANTVGGIAGVLLAVNVLMPLVGTKGLLGIGAAMDIGVGIFLLGSIPRLRRMEWAASSLVAAAVFVAVLSLAQMDALRLASGVYRTGTSSWPVGSEVLHYRDGKTASVALIRSGSAVTLTTNGKPDATINMGPGAPTADEPTMVMCSALALAANPSARTAANIGLGSGLTAHTLLSAQQITRLDTVEIEEEIVAASRGFGHLVAKVYDDPRSFIHIEDAKVFFSTRREGYDIIISEPSNPWVSGVASLYSKEFYQRVTDHLTEDGVFVQWFQIYEIDINVVSSIMKAVASGFSDYMAFTLTDYDLLIVGRKSGRFGSLSAAFLGDPGLTASLRRVGVQTTQDIEARWIGSKVTLDPLFQSVQAPINSDYHPFVDQNAVRTRFTRSDAAELTSLTLNALPLLEMLAPAGIAHGPLTATIRFARAGLDASARELRKAILERRYADAPAMTTPLMLLPQLLADSCSISTAGELWVDGLVELAAMIIPDTTPAELEPVWARAADDKCPDKLSPAHLRWLELVRAVSQRDAARMAAVSKAILSSMSMVQPSASVQYAMRAGMLGNLRSGSRGDATRIWSTYGEAAFAEQPLDVTLMLALDQPGAFEAWRSTFQSPAPLFAATTGQ